MQLVVKGMDKVIPHSRLPEAGSIVNSLAASGVSLSERGAPLAALGVQGRLGTPNLGAISFFLLPLSAPPTERDSKGPLALCAVMEIGASLQLLGVVQEETCQKGSSLARLFHLSSRERKVVPARHERIRVKKKICALHI